MNFFLLALPLIIFLADRLSKWWAVTALTQGPVYVCDTMSFVLLWNRGVSWSIFSKAEGPYFMLLTAVIVVIFLSLAGYTLWRHLNNFSIIPELLVLAGAFSNLIDRLWYGAVVDFIHLHVGDFSWPTFNVADAAIVIGVGCIMLRMWKDPYERP